MLVDIGKYDYKIQKTMMKTQKNNVPLVQPYGIQN